MLDLSRFIVPVILAMSSIPVQGVMPRATSPSGTSPAISSLSCCAQQVISKSASACVVLRSDFDEYVPQGQSLVYSGNDRR